MHTVHTYALPINRYRITFSGVVCTTCSDSHDRPYFIEAFRSSASTFDLSTIAALAVAHDNSHH